MIKSLWAKKSEENGQMRWLSLYQHLMDSISIADLLWEHWCSASQKELIISTLSIKSDDAVRSLVRFLAGAHDLGKATPAFQTKTGYANSKDLDDVLLEKLHISGFADISYLKLTAHQRSPHAIAGQTLLFEYGVSESVAAIVGSHHGRPSSQTVKTVARDQHAYPANYYQVEDEGHNVRSLWEATQRSYFEWVLTQCSFDCGDEIPSVLLPGQMLLSGLTIMADWIASNEHYFPLLDLDIAEVKDQESRTSYAWNLWSKVQPWEPRRVYSIDKLFQDRFKFTASSTQADFLECIQRAKEVGIFILEAPMGSGKTEAAFAAAEILAEKLGCHGVFFGLPTQATSNSMFSRMREWLESISAEQHEKMPLRLSHGKAVLNDEYSALPLSRQIDIDGDMNNTNQNSGAIFVNEWFSGRKSASLDDFVVGTVDQLLMMALNQRHLALRHLGNSRKVVIIDEAHAYDVYMGQYLDRALEWLGAYQVPVIIMSATLPASRRIEMVSAYLKGKGVKMRDIEGSVDKSLIAAYPLLTYSEGNEIKQIKVRNDGESKVVKIEYIDDESLMDVISDLIEGGGVLGIVVNTVKKAQEIAEVLIERYGSETVELLHSAFIASDRVVKEQNLISTIGKRGKRPVKKIIIGTQVIEQSLDIDFDVIISDLAPMDLLLQRIGRLHRHDRARPKKHKEPYCYVLGAKKVMEFDGGSKAIYHELILARTQYFIPESITIPDDISPLVQKVYSDSTLDLQEEYKLLYDKMNASEESYLANKRLKADVFRIDSPTWREKQQGTKVSLAGRFDTPQNYSEERAYAQVRDIDETIEIIVLQRIGEGYGFFGTSENLKEKISQPDIAKKIATQTISLPRALSAPYNVEKTVDELEEYNRDNLRTWRDQVWLKGALGMIFDSDGMCSLNGFHLRYDNEIGLKYERSVEGE